MTNIQFVPCFGGKGTEIHEKINERMPLKKETWQ